jgi:serpin B
MNGRRANRRPATSALALCAAAALLTAGCGSGSSGGRPPNLSDPAGVLVGKAQVLDPGSLTAADMATANTAFGFSLFQRLCAAQPSTNLTLSPASAAQALGMLAAGSGGATQRKVATMLHLPGWDSHVVAALHAQTAALAKVKQIKVSNHVFEQVGLTPEEQTLDDLATAYDADLRQLDFADEPGATNTINAAISHDTDGLIPKLFDGPLDASTQTVLADAILLDAKWQTPFTHTDPGNFHASGGKTVTAQLMRNDEARFASRTAGGWQSVVLPYQGGTLQAVALLPPAADANSCVTPTPGLMTGLTSGQSVGAGVVLPKLDLTQTLPLTRTLSDLGLPLTGDYSGLGHGNDTVDQVIQKVVMKVDENGTKAAAATGVAVGTSAVIGGSTITFDRPFLLVLQDTETHTPLFVARVADPTAS